MIIHRLLACLTAGHDADAEELHVDLDALRVPLFPGRRALHHRWLRFRSLRPVWGKFGFLCHRLL